jgi:ADP-ribose pyrophosphatase YjhB (NUDIX family)
MAEDNELLHIEGHTFDLDDLDYGERREIKRIARTEIYDEDVDGTFEDMNEDDLMPAIILVCMLRHDPSYTLEKAQKIKPRDLQAANGGPPTQPQVSDEPKPAAKPRSARSSTAKASATSGSPS